MPPLPAPSQPARMPTADVQRSTSARAGRFAAVLLIGALFSLAGCGSDDEPAAPPPEATAPEPAPVPAPPAATPLLQSSNDVQVLSTAALDAIVAESTATGLVGPARCDVQMINLLHATTAPDGTATTASGVVMVPQGASCPGPFPLVSYSRGTDLDRDRALSTPGDREASLVAALLASRGYLVAASDYLGYAGSTLPYHPYLHAGSEAATNLDLLRATRELAGARGIGLDGRVFVTGYSQGGQASMATQQAIQAAHADEFALAGAGHMSGPYSLTTSVTAAVDAMPLGQLGATFYVPFAITSLRRQDPAIYASPGDFFRSPYDQTIETLFPGPGTTSVVDLINDDKLPLLFAELVTDAFVDAVENPASPLNLALEQNSPIRFGPTAPTLLCGGSRDPVVDFANTRVAEASLTTYGAAALTVIDLENEPAYDDRLRDDLIPVSLYTGYHASLVPPLCMLHVANLFDSAPPAAGRR